MLRDIYTRVLKILNSITENKSNKSSHYFSNINHMSADKSVPFRLQIAKNCLAGSNCQCFKCNSSVKPLLPYKNIYYLQEEIIFLLLILCVFYSNLIDSIRTFLILPCMANLVFLTPVYLGYFICFLKAVKTNPCLHR